MRKTEVKENLVYLVIWVLLLLSPIISMWLRMANDSTMSFSWEEVLRSWRIFIPYLIVFLVHNFMIAPLLIYGKKPIAYWTLAVCILFVFQLYECKSRPDVPPRPDRIGLNRHDPPRPFDDMPPPEFRNHVPGDSVGEAGTPESFAQRRPAFDSDRRPPRQMHHKGPRGPHNGPPVFVGMHDIIALIVLVLMLGMNLGVKFYFKSSKDSKKLREMEKKSLEQQLEYLKYQINPHFFMNTLNNIHALVDLDPEEAKHSIVELSKMMRYVLHDGAKSQVLLSKDLGFLDNYIQLMKLRYTDKVSITVDIPDDLNDRMVPPMLLITFVENAFKHGVSYKRESFIDVRLTTTPDRLTFTCRNSKADTRSDTSGGVGLANTRQRLDIIYGDNYDLRINDRADTYEVVLDIPFMTTPPSLSESE